MFVRLDTHLFHATHQIPKRPDGMVIQVLDLIRQSGVPRVRIFLIDGPQASLQSVLELELFGTV